MKRLVLTLLVGVGYPAATWAQGDVESVVQLRSPLGTLLVRESKGWATPTLHDILPKGVLLMAPPGARAALDAREGDLRLTLAGNHPELSFSSALESAVVLHAANKADAAFTLQRGCVVLENKKDNGAATATVHIQETRIGVKLLTPASVVGLEWSSRWPAGTPFLKKAHEEHRPAEALLFLVLKGKVEIDAGTEATTLAGPALFRWTPQRGLQGPFALKAIPAWVNPALAVSNKATATYAAVEKLRRLMADLGASKGQAKALQAEDPRLRAIAGLTGFAMDDPASGITAFMDKHSPETRAAARAGALQYIGRGFSEDVRLYEAMLAANMKPGQAEIAMELLHGLGAQASNRPETRDTLVEYLQSDHIIIRDLANWTLVQMLPLGSSIAFDAAAGPDQRAQAQAAWRKLISAK